MYIREILHLGMLGISMEVIPIIRIGILKVRPVVEEEEGDG
jgi:hypothetical protein